MSDVISGTMLDRFCTSAGPARLTLLSMIRSELDRPTSPPLDSLGCLDPLRSILKEARDNTAILDDENSGLDHSYAIDLNKRLDFDSPAWVDGERTHLEIDTLLQLARIMGATIAGDRREILTPVGTNLLEDPLALWRSTAWTIPALPYANQQITDTWELILAWLLIDGEEFDAQFAAISEVIGEDEEGLPEIFQIATCSLYTLARGLNMFVPRPRHILKKPVLNEFGRATAIEALRSAVLLKWNDFRSIA